MFSCICPLKLLYHCNTFFIMDICFNKTAVQEANYSVAGGVTALPFAPTMRQPQQGCTQGCQVVAAKLKLCLFFPQSERTTLDLYHQINHQFLLNFVGTMIL